MWNESKVKSEVPNAVRIYLYTYDKEGKLKDNFSFISFDSPEKNDTIIAGC